MPQTGANAKRTRSAFGCQTVMTFGVSSSSEATAPTILPEDFGQLLSNPGTKRAAWVRLLEFADGNLLKLPVIVVNGRHAGETVYVGAGIHGTEINGISAAIESMQALDPNHVHGSVVAVPIENPYGYQHRSRLFEFEHQVDAEVLNLHRMFPGVRDGSPHERMVSVLYRIMKESGATFHFDLHTGHRGAETPPHTFIGPNSLGKVVDTAREAAHYFECDFIVGEASAGDDVIYARPGMHHVALSREGVPVLGAELGAGGLRNPNMIRIGRDGILNVLRHRGVLQDGIAPVRHEQPVLSRVHAVRTNHGGLYEPLVRPGDRVQAQQPIAKVTSVFGDLLEEVKAPVTGYITTLTIYPALHEGERVCRIGEE